MKFVSINRKKTIIFAVIFCMVLCTSFATAYGWKLLNPENGILNFFISGSIQIALITFCLLLVVRKKKLNAKFLAFPFYLLIFIYNSIFSIYFIYYLVNYSQINNDYTYTLCWKVEEAGRYMEEKLQDIQKSIMAEMTVLELIMEYEASEGIVSRDGPGEGPSYKKLRSALLQYYKLVERYSSLLKKMTRCNLNSNTDNQANCEKSRSCLFTISQQVPTNSMLVELKKKTASFILRQNYSRLSELKISMPTIDKMYVDELININMMDLNRFLNEMSFEEEIMILYIAGPTIYNLMYILFIPYLFRRFLGSERNR